MSDLVIRPRPIAWLRPVAVAGYALVARPPLWWVALAGAVVALDVVYLLRARTTLAPDGVTTCDGFRTRRAAWADVERLAPCRGGFGAHTRDGRAIKLFGVPTPFVEPPPTPERSARRVADYARAHGHEIQLVHPPCVRATGTRPAPPGQDHER